MRYTFTGALKSLGATAAVVYVFSQLSGFILPAKPEVSPVRKDLLAKLVPSMVDDLRASREDIKSAAVAHFVNDPSDYVTDQMRQALGQAGTFNVVDAVFLEKIARALHMDVTSTNDVDGAVKLGKKLGVDGVVIGGVQAFESYAAGARADINIKLVRVADGRVLLDKQYIKDFATPVLSAPAIQEGVTRLGAVKRFLAWSTIVVLLPLASFGFVRQAVKKQSNRSNAYTLGLYVALDAVLAFLLLGADFSSLISVLLFLLLIGGAVAYNVWVMSLALKLES